MILNSENLGALKFKTKKVAFKKAEGEFIVALIPAEMIAERSDVDAKGDMADYGMRCIQAAVVDEKGKPVFDNAESFEKLPNAIQDEILKAVYDYNGLSAVAAEELEKN